MELHRTFRVGTRTSPLALRQVDEVISALKRRYPEMNPSTTSFDRLRTCPERSRGTLRIDGEQSRTIKFEIVRIDTYGDKDKTTPISDIEGTDFFTRELDDALLKSEIDFAVHSAKDLPDEIEEGLHVAAITESIDPYDALVSKDNLELVGLPFNARIGTSSSRRKNQLKSYRSDFEIVDIRGNIEERLKLLDSDDSRNLNAIVIAACALVRLGLENRITERIPFEILRPHPLQGSLAIETRKDDLELIDLLKVLKKR